MQTILSVYSECALKEYVLPAAQNTETALAVRSDVFGLGEDLTLTLENSDGNWRFTGTCAEKLRQDKRPYTGQWLHDGDYFGFCMQGDRVALAILIRETEQNFSQYDKFIMQPGRIFLGSAPDCALQFSFENNGSQYITQHHAELQFDGKAFAVTDHSLNGIFVNERRVRGQASLGFGDHLDAWGLNVVVLGGVLAVRRQAGLTVRTGVLRPSDMPCAPLDETAGEQGIHYHRSPRSIGSIEHEPFTIEAPPSPQNGDEPPLLLTVGPALTMALPMIAGSAMAVMGSATGGAYMYTGIVTSVLSALIGAVWAIANVRYAAKQRKKLENQRFSAYSDYLVRVTEEIRTRYEHNAQVLQALYPSAEQCLRDGMGGQHLWERNVGHGDFLAYRLGLGDLPFQSDIRIPPEKFELIPDSLRDKPRMIRENYQTLHSVPVCVDLQKERLVGLVGGPDLVGAREILQNLVAQIAVQNCYTDVKMAFVYRQDIGDDTTKWEYCRWLPHVWSGDRKLRLLAANKAEASDVFFELAGVLRTRSEQQIQPGTRPVPKPWYILVIEDSAVLENEPIARYLLDPAQELGITTIFLADRAEDLPNTCDCIICKDSAFTGMYHAHQAEREQGRLNMETVDRGQLERLARYLANVQVNEVEVGGEIPNAITFFDMYHVARPEELHADERWKRSRSFDTMRALIGVKNGQQPCYLDVHEKYHGPHGLVAGTTGSGKSETLQTYILSLTLNFSPYDVGLFIIDYKGGGMANLFCNLPHMLGAISNLSGGQVHRAMVSIKSENKRRQRIFNENGVNNINLYTALYKNGEAKVPVPHLFIIIDEFAELKREQPDFMRELISVAQVGRSLGVHLILATQKPSGTVDDNIWSNSKFRICLRVQDRQDSMDMLHKPDAAYLTQAGRGYLQVGSDEVFELFQSGWSGAAYDEETAGSKQVLARMLTNTGRTALVGSYIKRQQKAQALQRWMEQLLQICADWRAVHPGQTGHEGLKEAYYRTFAQRSIDFPQSEYNDRLLENFLRLGEESRSQPAAQRAEWIAQTAARRNLKLPERREKTQLAAVVEYLNSEARQQGYEPLPPLWLPPLPTELYLSKSDAWQNESFRDGAWPALGRQWELAVVIGRADDPENQSQMPVSVNFTAGGHYALIGSAGTGRSTFVQTMLYALVHRYTPDYLNVYVLDFSSHMTAPFEDCAQVGGILGEQDLPQVGKLFFLLRTIVAERKKKFRGGSYEQYVMVNGVEDCPAVLLVIDNMANFREKTGEAYDGELIRLAREGASYGIHLFVTGSGFNLSDIPSRLADQLRTTVTLTLADRFQYGDVLRCQQPDVVPEAGVRGRGLIAVDGRVLEYQTALAQPAEDDYGRADAIRAECAALNRAWTGRTARSIPMIPEKPVWADLCARSEFPALAADPRTLPIGYEAETAGIYTVDLASTFCYVVSGHARTGKTNTVKIMMRAAAAKQAKLFVLEQEEDGGRLRLEAEQLGARWLSGQEQTKDFLLGQLGPEFGRRSAIKKELEAAGAEEEAKFQRMSQEQPWFVFVRDLTSLLRMMRAPGDWGQYIENVLVNLLSRGFMNNIYFVAGFDQDDQPEVSGLPVYEEFVRSCTGVHLGGNVAGQQLFDYNDMSYRDQSTPEKPGVGLVPSHNGEPSYRIILPQAKG